MASKKNAIQLVPSASRLIQSLRDLGYEFNSAVADLVDNSIAADASAVSIQMQFEGSHSWLRIADNGRGMDAAELTEAMRYGAHQTYEDGSLGKFGLGIKTASMSQCQRLTVATRRAKSRRIEVRRWDIQHIEKTDRWEVLALVASECPDHLIGPLEDGSGTVVLWERLDRMMAYKIPEGEKARKGFLGMAEGLEAHLAMVFHRFLAGEARRRRKLTITVNGNPLEAWDPFCRSERATEDLGEKPEEIETPIGSGIVRFRGFVLPSKSRFSSEEAWNRASGPKKWNNQQGLYVYREDRLIKCGGWFGYRTIDEHLKCARASVDFRRELDAPFKINVSKLRTELPHELFEKFEKPLQALLKRAKAKYSGDDDSPRQPERRRVPVAAPAPASVPRAGRTDGGSGLSVVAEAQRSPRQALEAAAARAGEERALRAIVIELKKHDDEVARDLGY